MVLWKLAQYLYKKFPDKVFVVDKNQGPFSIPTYDKCKELKKDWIAIYPEVVTGNPLSAGTVVRYLLNLPGVIGGPVIFPESDLMFVYSEFFNRKMNYSADRVLKTPYLEYERFQDLHQKRSEKFFYKGKGTVDKKLNAEDLGSGKTFSGPGGQDALVARLNRCEVLYSYDSISAMIEIARLCGCPVVIIPSSQYSKEDCQAIGSWSAGGIGYGLEEESYAKKTINSDRLRAYYKDELASFDSKLNRFVEITQQNLPMEATKSTKDEGIEVSICCATYNQASLLSNALDSFLMQRTTFPFEIIIYDDASTDETQKLIKEYAAKYPDLIRSIHSKENQFRKNGFYPYGEFLYPQARGRYIAECDGDDFWTDPLKIQKQWEFMEAHPEYSLCYHDYLILANERYSSGRVPPPKYTRLEFVNYPSYPYDIQTSTKFWRNIFTESRRQDFIDFTGDIATNVLNGMHGEAAFVPGIKPSVFWFKSPSSSWCSMSKEDTQKKTTKLWNYLYKTVEKKGNPQWTYLRERFLSSPFNNVVEMQPIRNRIKWRDKLQTVAAQSV
jgi:hypothetical protein